MVNNNNTTLSNTNKKHTFLVSLFLYVSCACKCIGDCFNATVIACMSRGFTIEEAIRCACQAAGNNSKR